MRNGLRRIIRLIQEYKDHKTMEYKLAIIGLGYVGLPLAVEFGKKFKTLGFDINEARVQELKQGKDSTLEVEPAEFRQATNLGFTTDTNEIRDCNIYIVTVPTPIDQHKRPDLTPLVKASEMLGGDSHPW